MRNLLFKSIWILSRKNRAARAIHFHHQKNLLVGRNHTGKSSLIKTLFETLGATPNGNLDKWDYGVTTLIKLSIDGIAHFVLHQNGHRALLNANLDQISVTSSHREWTEIFSKLLDFNLVIIDKQSASVPADPKCFFLPFYINQDGSWQSKWDTFKRLEQYSKPIPAILECFTGVKPPEFYRLNAEKTRITRELEELDKEQRFLKKAWDRIGQKMSMAGPKLEPENFENEISMLTTEVSELNRKQEILRDSIVRERELTSNIQLQIKLADQVLQTYDRDSNFLQSHQETLVCPTCSAEHAKPFIDVLKYAEDARVLRDLVTQLRADLTKASKRVGESRNQLDELTQNYRKVSELLEARKGTLKLQEVLNGMGAEQAFNAFQVEFDTLKRQIDGFLGSIKELNTKLKALTDRKISAEILKTFRTAYSLALISLNLPSIDMKKVKLTSRPELSGSGGPRQILAYYSALWVTALGEHGSFNVPIVIDSPNQQGQDAVNLPAILEFISVKLPSKSQVIVGSEINTPHPFDKIFELTEPYAFLQASEFNEISAFLEPLEHKLFLELDRRSPTVF